MRRPLAILLLCSSVSVGRLPQAGAVPAPGEGTGPTSADTSLIPPAPPKASIVTNWFEMVAFDGTNYSRPSNEISWTNGRCVLTWSNSPCSNITYALLSGRESGRENRTNFLGHVNTVAWPLPGPPPVPPQFHFQTSTDLKNWTDLLVVTGNLAEPERFYRLINRQ